MTGLLGPADVRRLARDLGVRPTKTLGQNFVIDPNTIRRIVRTADVRADDVVLEIGPGLGSLTLGLLGVARRVIAVEIDGVLAAALPATVESFAPDLADRLDVVHADALALDTFAEPRPTVLVANLPYNVAVPVLLHLLSAVPSLRAALVMVQAEVAARLAAPPGSRTYGAPSAKVAWYAEAKRVATVPRTVFWPVPNVDSALVGLTTRAAPETTARRDDVFRVIDAAFGQRRKTLRSALAAWAGDATRAGEILDAAGVDHRLRGEALDIGAFARIAAAAAG